MRARRCVPQAMTRGAVAGFPVLILAAMGTWGVYGVARVPQLFFCSCVCRRLSGLNQLCMCLPVTGPMCAWPNTFLQGRAAAVGLAMFNVIGSIGGFVSPFIVGKLSNNGDYANGMFLLGAFNLCAALMVLGEHPSNFVHVSWRLCRDRHITPVLLCGCSVQRAERARQQRSSTALERDRKTCGGPSNLKLLGSQSCTSCSSAL